VNFNVNFNVLLKKYIERLCVKIKKDFDPNLVLKVNETMCCTMRSTSLTAA
jgi:hypothetical protein